MTKMTFQPLKMILDATKSKKQTGRHDESMTRKQREIGKPFSKVDLYSSQWTSVNESLAWSTLWGVNVFSSFSSWSQTSPERQFQSLKTHWCRSHLKCRSWTSLHLRTTSTLCAVSNIVTSGSPWSWHHLRTSSACASVWSRKCKIMITITKNDKNNDQII